MTWQILLYSISIGFLCVLAAYMIVTMIACLTMVKRTKCRRKGKFAILHLVRIADSLVTVLSLGYFQVDWYTDLLFSDWTEDID